MKRFLPLLILVSFSSYAFDFNQCLIHNSLKTRNECLLNLSAQLKTVTINLDLSQVESVKHKIEIYEKTKKTLIGSRQLANRIEETELKSTFLLPPGIYDFYLKSNGSIDVVFEVKVSNDNQRLIVELEKSLMDLSLKNKRIKATVLN